MHAWVWFIYFKSQILTKIQIQSKAEFHHTTPPYQIQKQEGKQKRLDLEFFTELKWKTTNKKIMKIMKNMEKWTPREPLHPSEYERRRGRDRGVEGFGGLLEMRERWKQDEKKRCFRPLSVLFFFIVFFWLIC